MKDYIKPEERTVNVLSKKYDDIYLAITFLISFFSVITLMTWGN